MSRVILVGGIGRLEAMYRQTVESLGHVLDYCERSVPRAASVEQIVAVCVVVNVSSHPQREAAERIAAALGLKVHYLRSASPSALRKALDSKEVVCVGG